VFFLVFSGCYFSAREKDSSIGKNHDQKKVRKNMPPKRLERHRKLVRDRDVKNEGQMKFTVKQLKRGFPERVERMRRPGREDCQV
jgi:hypothetical protein